MRNIIMKAIEIAVCKYLTQKGIYVDRVNTISICPYQPGDAQSIYYLKSQLCKRNRQQVAGNVTIKLCKLLAFVLVTWSN